MMKDMVKSVIQIAGGLVVADLVYKGLNVIVKAVEKNVENSKEG